MKGYTTKQIMTPGFNMPDSYDELMKVYRTLAKSADQRLVRLEKYAQDKNFRNATQYAYARASRDIESWAITATQSRGRSIKQEKPRFNTAPPVTKSGLQAKIKDIQTFLSAPTSTKSGIQEIYVKRAETINAKFGTSFTWEDIGDFFESSMYNSLDKRYDSGTIVEAWGVIQKNEDIVEKIMAEKEKHVKVKDRTKIDSDDPMIKKAVEDIVNHYSKSTQRLLGM